MYWLDDNSGGQRAAAAAARGVSGVIRKENREREAPGAGAEADSTGPYEDPK